jgi:hypothetical protein
MLLAFMVKQGMGAGKQVEPARETCSLETALARRKCCIILNRL